MKTALVTGASGFVGGNLVRRLLERGRNVRVLVRPQSDRGNVADLPVDIRVGDLREPLSLEKAVEGCDEVYHVAAEYGFWYRDSKLLYDSNVEGTRNLMTACENARTPRIVYCSTVGTIGLEGAPNPCNETTPMAPGQLTSHYKLSKLGAEKVALEFAAKGMPIVIVNPSAPIGAWDRKPTPTGKIVVDFVNGKMPAYLETGLNLVHVLDVAEGHILAAEKGRVGERYILGHRNLSLSEILSILSKITGISVPKIKIPYAVAYTAGWVSTKLSDWVTHDQPAVPLEAVKMAKRFMYFNAAKAVQELGLPQTPVEKALEDAVEWFAANGYFNKRREEIKWQSQ